MKIVGEAIELVSADILFETEPFRALAVPYAGHLGALAVVVLVVKRFGEVLLDGISTVLCCHAEHWQTSKCSKEIQLASSTGPISDDAYCCKICLEPFQNENDDDVYTLYRSK